MKTPTLAQFKQFSRSSAPLVAAVAAATAFATAERARVDAYIEPIFLSYGFKDENGIPISRSRDIYLCLDDARCAEFFDACDAAHRAHGFTGPAGHCPALTAATARIAAENKLLKAGGDLFGADFAGTFGETRDEALRLMVGQNDAARRVGVLA